MLFNTFPHEYQMDAKDCGPASLKVLMINNAQSQGAQFINQLMNIGVTFYCTIAVINGTITFGMMISS